MGGWTDPWSTAEREDGSVGGSAPLCCCVAWGADDEEEDDDDAGGCGCVCRPGSGEGAREEAAGAGAMDDCTRPPSDKRAMPLCERGVSGPEAGRDAESLPLPLLAAEIVPRPATSSSASSAAGQDAAGGMSSLLPALMSSLATAKSTVSLASPAASNFAASVPAGSAVSLVAGPASSATLSSEGPALSASADCDGLPGRAAAVASAAAAAIDGCLTDVRKFQ